MVCDIYIYDILYYTYCIRIYSKNIVVHELSKKFFIVFYNIDTHKIYFIWHHSNIYYKITRII